MKKGIKIFIVVLVILVILAIPVIGSYNTLVTLEQNVAATESNIATQLQRRSDLIPNLVSTVQGYATQEKEIFTQIADARSRLAGATTVEEQSAADNQLTQALSRLLVIVERYPELKSSQNFKDLSIQLEGTENRIAIARQDYNTAATTYNTKRRKFPTTLLASLFGFEEKPLYQASEAAQQAPVVDFSNR